jgi:thioredoxin-like negative regulator of GroEL
MAGDNTLNFTDGSFDKEVLNSDVPVLVDFWAPRQDQDRQDEYG